MVSIGTVAVKRESIKFSKASRPMYYFYVPMSCDLAQVHNIFETELLNGNIL
jgi:hypothetical protein